MTNTDKIMHPQHFGTSHFIIYSAHTVTQVRLKQSTYEGINVEQSELDSKAQHEALTAVLEN